MRAILLLLFATLALAQESRFVLVIQFPYDQKIKLPFYRTGALEKIDAEGEVRRKKTTRIRVELKDAPDPEGKAYVLWAVRADKSFRNLGAISKNLETETPLKDFGLVVSLESDPKAAQPMGTFVLETHFPDKKTRYFGMTKVVYTGK